jgi:hypothetical protein
MYKNWLDTNVKDRLLDKTIKYKAWFNPRKFEVMSFHEAADYTTKQIAELNVPLYLGLSGGMDSKYAFLCFHRNKIDIVPIIVKTHGNDYETTYAFHLCKKLNVTPIVLTISENEYVMLFNNLIADKLNGIGLNSVSSILAGFYAQ